MGWRSLDATNVAVEDIWELLVDVLQVFGLWECDSGRFLLFKVIWEDVEALEWQFGGGGVALDTRETLRDPFGKLESH